MKKQCKTILIIISIFLSLVAIIAVPIIINELYMKNDGYLTLWGAEEVLSYYGNVLAFIGTVLLGALSLYQNNIFKKSNENKEKLMIRPYLFTVIEDENPIYLAENEKEYILIDYMGDEFRVKHSSRNIHSEIGNYKHKKKEYSDFLNLPKDKQEHSKHLRLLQEQTDIVNNLNQRFELVRYKIANAGQGNAINIDITLNGGKVVPLFCLTQNESKELLFLFDFKNAIKNNEYTFNIEFSFYDIEVDKPYHQKETFYINKDSDNNLSLRFKEQISIPYNKEDTQNA